MEKIRFYDNRNNHGLKENMKPLLTRLGFNGLCRDAKIWKIS